MIDETVIESVKKYFELVVLPVATMEDADKVIEKIQVMSIDELNELHYRVHAVLENTEMFHDCLMAEIKKRTNKEVC